MAADTNVVVLVGRLTRNARRIDWMDAEQKQVGETTIQSMRLAFTSRSKRGGEWSDESNYVDVTLFCREGLGRFLVKGTRIGVTGRLSWREWETADGQRRQAIEVVAQDVQLLDGKREGGGGDLPGEWGTLKSEPAPADDSIPF